MEVIPVIDLKDGQVVHARAGRRDEYRPILTPLSPSIRRKTWSPAYCGCSPFVASISPISMPSNSVAAMMPHSLSLRRQIPALMSGSTMVSGMRLPRLPGWIENLGHLVIGSESQSGTRLIRALRHHPRVALSLDFRGDAFLGPSEILQNPDLWPERVIVMTLARVGGGQGPDLHPLADIQRRAPLQPSTRQAEFGTRRICVRSAAMGLAGCGSLPPCTRAPS